MAKIQFYKFIVIDMDRRENNAELIAANKELAIMQEDAQRKAEELLIAYKDLAFEIEEKGKRAAELILANIELKFQNQEKENRASELAVANRELAFQNLEKEKRAHELTDALTDLRKLNEELERKVIKRTAQYALISQVNQAVVKVKDEEALFEEVCKIALKYGKFEIVWIGIFDTVKNKVIKIHSRGILENELNKYLGTPFEITGSQTEVLQSNKYFICNDNESNFKGSKSDYLSESQHINSFVVLPIRKFDTIYGTLNLYASEVNFFEKEDIVTLQEVAGDISFGLELFEYSRRHKEAEEIIIKNEKGFRALVEFSADAVIVLSVEGKPNYVSPAVEKVLGYTETELMQIEFISLIHPVDFLVADKIWKQMLNNPGVPITDNPCRMKHRDGTWRWMEGTLTNLLRDSSVNGIVNNFRDVTVRKEIEKALQLSNFAMENTGDAVLWLTPDGRIVSVNQAAHEMLGYAKNELLDLSLSDIDPYFETEKWPIHFEDLKQKRTFFFERVHRSKDGTLIPVEIRANYIKFEDAEFNCAFVRNISERKISEQEREKLTASILLRNLDLEQFTYILSHNLRTPIANIIGIAEILEDVFLTPKEQKQYLQALSISTSRLDIVVKEINTILEVKRNINGSKETISFPKLVQGVITDLQSVIDKNRVDVKTDFKEADELYSLKSYMSSIFYNLISNSIKYSNPDKDAYIEIKSQLENGKIVLFFRDNGLGIDLKNNGDEIFGLYKRFHSHVEGRGLGLFMVKAQVESIGGKISVESVVNEGTEFRVEFDS